ncbi:cysteine dioxygenase [Achromobacter denitrificans]|uniref:cysteine dioxygenase family protein n=1 Tax=Achromobacter denitrificans TaxID=32002 RepID=UPI001668CACE|nr:cysteine dioxygenase family protein [Achromobacter denitrificans]GFN26201.1 cysteine dioxygenase [Achromobacter denitrificans]
MPAFPQLAQRQPAAPPLARFSEAQAVAATRYLDDMRRELGRVDNWLEWLDEDKRKGEEGTYVRHLLHASDDGSFAMMFLVWRPGQFSPVHGHKTWCVYKVLAGELTEEFYACAASGGVRRTGQRARRPGDVTTASAGISQIHRLGNGGEDVAISLHVYGVRAAEISTGVNIVMNELS